MLRFDPYYKIIVGDDLGSPTFWNNRLQDIDLRLNQAEGYSSRIDQAVADVINAGLSRINDTFQPLMNTLVVDINTLTAEVAALETTIITDQESVISQLNDLLEQAQTLVANMQSLGTISDGTF